MYSLSRTYEPIIFIVLSLLSTGVETLTNTSRLMDRIRLLHKWVMVLPSVDKWLTFWVMWMMHCHENTIPPLSEVKSLDLWKLLSLKNFIFLLEHLFFFSVISISIFFSFSYGSKLYFVMVIIIYNSEIKVWKKAPYVNVSLSLPLTTFFFLW